MATLQQVLADERLRALNIDAEDGHRTVRADLLIADRLAAILRQQGRDLYADFDRRRASSSSAGRREKDPRLLEEVGRSYPVARVVPDALLALGRAPRRPAGRRTRARAYKRLLAWRRDGPGPGPGPLGAGPRLRGAEASGSRPATPTPRPSPGSPSRHRARRDRAPARPTWSPAGWPARRSTGWPATAPSRACRSRSADAGTPRPGHSDGRSRGRRGVPPSAEAGRIFLARDEAPAGRPGTGPPALVGRPGRRRRLGRLPRRPDHRRDRQPAGRAGLETGGADTGSTTRRSRARPPGAANPFARARAAGGRTSGPRGRSTTSGSSAAGSSASGATGTDRLRRRHRAGRLVVHAGPAGAINPHLWIGPQRVVLPVRKPNAVLVLETDDRPPPRRVPAGRGGGTGRAPRCRSTTTTSRSWPTAGPSPCSTSPGA